MKIGLYAVKDNLNNTFMAPTTIKSDNEAIRAFKSQVNKIDIWKDNPGDFSLYKVGYYDDETGTIEPGVEMIASGRSVLND